MAYAAAVTVQDIRQGGKRVFIVTVEETEAATASEFQVPLPSSEIMTLTKYKATLTAGAGATINPIIGRASGWTLNTQDHIGAQTTTAAHIDDEKTVTFLNPGSIWVKSRVDSGADNSISTEMIFVEGQVT